MNRRRRRTASIRSRARARAAARCRRSTPGRCRAPARARSSRSSRTSRRTKSPTWNTSRTWCAASIKHRDELDDALQPFLDRDIEQVDPIERAVLRIAAYELRQRLDVPYRVVINEAIETTKRFGSEHGHTYVNGVLDHAAAAWRAAEVQAARAR